MWRHLKQTLRRWEPHCTPSKIESSLYQDFHVLYVHIERDKKHSVRGQWKWEIEPISTSLFSVWDIICALESKHNNACKTRLGIFILLCHFLKTWNNDKNISKWIFTFLMSALTYMPYNRHRLWKVTCSQNKLNFFVALHTCQRQILS